VGGMAACPSSGAISEERKNALEARRAATPWPLAREINVCLRECRKRVFSAPTRGLPTSARNCPQAFGSPRVECVETMQHADGFIGSRRLEPDDD